MYRLDASYSPCYAWILVCLIVAVGTAKGQEFSDKQYALQHNCATWIDNNDPSHLIRVFQDTTIAMHSEFGIAGIATNDHDEVIGVGVGMQEQAYIFRVNDDSVEVLLERKGQLPRGIGMWEASDTKFGLAYNNETVEVLARKDGQIKSVGTLEAHIYNVQPLDSVAVVVATEIGTFLLDSTGRTEMYSGGMNLQRSGDSVFGVDPATESVLVVHGRKHSVQKQPTGSLIWVLTACNSTTRVYEPAEPWRTVLHTTNVGPLVRVEFADGTVSDYYGSNTLPLSVALLILLAGYNWRRISKNRQRPAGKAWK